MMWKEPRRRDDEQLVSAASADSITAVILIFLKERVRLQRIISAVSVFVNIFVAGFIVYQVNTNGIQTLYMGGWRPPYGIVFVADMFSALLVLTAVTLLARLVCFFPSLALGKTENGFITIRFSIFY